MNRQQSHTTRPPIRAARWQIELSAILAAMGVAAAVVPPMADVAGRAEPSLTRRSTAPFSRLSAILSHNDVYRASLVAPSDPPGTTGSRAWVIEVQTATGRPVENAALSVESWMPDNDAVRATHPRVTGYFGAGRYHVEGLRFDHRGWWNVRLQVVGAAGTDSLAFNIVR
ncbi:MAG TPA: FixH family protein [Gemmatimonadaceae bacterium]|nr:FixH family protein [Gemmatimonadaceae bacterium]